jgi:hypothetical protein
MHISSVGDEKNLEEERKNDEAWGSSISTDRGTGTSIGTGIGVGMA